MINGIDHIALEVADRARAAADYCRVLGGAPHDTPGTPTGLRLQLANVGVVIREAAPMTEAADAPTRVRLVFAVPDLAKAAHRLARRGLQGGTSGDGGRHDLEAVATHGVAVGLAQAGEPGTGAVEGDIAGLDHVVVRTPDPERAVALYGGRLGLDLRLDRTSTAHANRLLFFVCGSLVVEIAHDMRAGVGSGPDRLWGLAWRARDLDAAHARMAAGGVDVSAVRDGRRPGTRVFTVRSHTSGLPTLVIGGEGLVRQ